MSLHCRLVLASASPQRRKIFADAGYTFEIADPGDVEDGVTSAASPDELAVARARAKAEAVAARLTGPFPVLAVGCDTLVALGNEVIGKPVDRADASAILARLSGTTHRCVSGVCVVALNAAGQRIESLCAVVSTAVRMRRWTAAEIAAYVASGESDGKAGAYAIQEGGDRFVESLEGSFLNVVGFPLEHFQSELLPRALASLGLKS